MATTSSPTVEPRLVLAFYEGGIVLQKKAPDGATTAYPVDPAHVQEAFADVAVSSPILPANVLCWGRVRGGPVFAWWRPPARERLLVEVDEHVLTWNVPLPGIVLVCSPHGLGLAAVKGDKRPIASTPAYSAPLPNTDVLSPNRFGVSGKVCMGSARLPEAPGPDNFDEVWGAYVRSTFNAHMSHHKSVSYPDDVRALLMSLHEQGSEVFPEDELVAGEAMSLEEFLRPWTDPRSPW